MNTENPGPSAQCLCFKTRLNLKIWQILNNHIYHHLHKDGDLYIGRDQRITFLIHENHIGQSNCNVLVGTEKILEYFFTFC